MRAFRSILACILALGVVTGVPATVSAQEPEMIPADDSAVIRFESEDDGEEPSLSLPPGETQQEQPDQNDGDIGEDGTDGEPETDDLELETTDDLPDSLPDCETVAQLQMLLEENDGGTVTLTDNIVVNGYQWLSANTHTTVIMGQYSIVVSVRSALIINDPLSFEGNGTREPLFQVMSGGNLVMLDKVSITSTGIGSTAIFLADGAEIISDDVQISAEGEGSTAIRADGDMYLSQAVIKAVGQDGVGIHAGGDVDIFYSDISGDLAAVLSDTGEITLDTSVVSPAPENARVIDRKAVYETARYGIWIEPGDTPYLQDYLLFVLYNINDIEDSKDLILPVEWEIPSYDPNMPGEHKLYFTPLLPINGIDGLERTAITLHIADPLIPSLYKAEWYHNTVTIYFFREIQGADSMTLRYSLDKGENWADAAADFSAIVTNGSAKISGLDKDEVYWFRLDVTGGLMDGESNIIKSWYSPLKDDGGDRTGADRFPQTGPDDGGSQPGDGGDGNEDGSGGDSGGDGTGGGNNPGDPVNPIFGGNSGHGTDTDNDTGYRITFAFTPDRDEAPPADTAPSNTLSDIPPLEVVTAAPAFHAAENPENPAAALEETGLQKEQPSALTAVPPSESLPEPDAAKLQPSLPQPPFHTGMAMTLAGSAAAVSAGASAWIKIRRLRSR